MNRNSGFTLIELMITVAVIAILVRIALPNYTAYVTRGNIPEATTGLSQMRARIEQYYADNRTYVGFTCPSPERVKNFTFTCPTLTATAYSLQASGNSSSNVANFVYTINQAGTRTSDTPWGDSGNCWVSSSNGGC